MCVLPRSHRAREKETKACNSTENSPPCALGPGVRGVPTTLELSWITYKKSKFAT